MNNRLPPLRRLSGRSRTIFLSWTAFWWGGVVVFGTLFYTGVLDFETSTKAALYGISVWLNGCLLALIGRGKDGRSVMEVLHDCLVLWMLTYFITNFTWELPWVLSSRTIFQDLHTLDDLVAQTAFMREHVWHMYYWVMASFGSVDLRTVNHNSTFFTVEFFAFYNVLSILYFFYLNNRRSRYRYLIPVLSGGITVAATFIFSLSEVFNGYENMPGGVADTLLALLWTQYQYVLFPMLGSYWGIRLFMADVESVYQPTR